MDAFYDKCLTSHFPTTCSAGFSVLTFGFIFFTLNSLAFIKMTNYYGKMNFENTVLLLSSIQSVMLLIEIMIAKNVLISVFIFIQILSMCLINFKFNKISKGFVKLKYNYLTKIVLSLDIIYLFVFITIFIIESLNHIDNILYYLSSFYYLLEIFSSFLLSYYCCVFLGIIKKIDKKKNQNIFNDYYRRKITNLSDNINNNIKNEETTNKSSSAKFNMVGDGLFYLVKKRQITLLYLGNILFSFFALGFDTTMTFVITDEKKDIYQYIYYTYFLFCFIHNSINYISFYWLVREQYKKLPDVDKDDIIEEEKENKLINSKYIEEEIINIENENKRISKYIDDDKKIKRIETTDSFGDNN